MFRQFSIDLQTWLRRKDRRPLLLRGARQVGKTWLARALAREQGLDLVEVNFELRADAKEVFRNLEGMGWDENKHLLPDDFCGRSHFLEWMARGR